jgi:hypothetical protein
MKPLVLSSPFTLRRAIHCALAASSLGLAGTAHAAGVITGFQLMDPAGGSVSEFTVDNLRNTVDFAKAFNAVNPLAVRFTVGYSPTASSAPYTVTESVRNLTGQSWAGYQMSLSDPPVATSTTTTTATSGGMVTRGGTGTTPTAGTPTTATGGGTGAGVGTGTTAAVGGTNGGTGPRPGASNGGTHVVVPGSPEDLQGAGFANVQSATLGGFTLNSKTAGPSNLSFTGALANAGNARARFALLLRDPGQGGSYALNLRETPMTATAAVPVPAAAWLLGSALVGLGTIRRRRTGAA